MGIDRRQLLAATATGSGVVTAGCMGVLGSCGPADEMAVEDLLAEEPTGITRDFEDQYTLEGEVVTVDVATGESMRIDDSTGLAELYAGPGAVWSPTNMPEQGDCVVATGYLIETEYDTAHVALSDVTVSIG